MTAVELLEKAFYGNAEFVFGVFKNKWMINEKDLERIFEEAKKHEQQQIEETQGNIIRKKFSTRF